jgi:hypothetical protein
MPCGFRQMARSISFLSPILRSPEVLLARKIASLIIRPERRFLAVTSFQSFRRPIFKLGSSSLISRRRHSFSDSPPRLRPPGNIQSRSIFRLTRRTFPRFLATSFEDFAIPSLHACRGADYPDQAGSGNIIFQARRVAPGRRSHAAVSATLGVDRTCARAWPGAPRLWSRRGEVALPRHPISF